MNNRHSEILRAFGMLDLLSSLIARNGMERLTIDDVVDDYWPDAMVMTFA